MAENYSISVSGSEISFSESADKIPDFVASSVFDPQKMPKDVAIVCRMGQPDLAHCIIYRYAHKAGGIFAMHEQGELLYAAVAHTNLAYSLAKGFFGNLTAATRYGVDIFEAADDD